MQPKGVRGLVSVGLLLLMSLTTGLSSARTAEKTVYTKSQVFHGALRYLRVEQRYEVTEKDLESGYLLFRYPTRQEGKETWGSVEVIERQKQVLLVVQLAEMPEYHERHLIDGLMRKLERDYGAPADRPDEPPPKDDDGTSEDEREESKPAAPEQVPHYRIK